MISGPRVAEVCVLSCFGASPNAVIFNFARIRLLRLWSHNHLVLGLLQGVLHQKMGANKADDGRGQFSVVVLSISAYAEAIRRNR
jgi:hypothetical protein